MTGQQENLRMVQLIDLLSRARTKSDRACKTILTALMQQNPLLAASALKKMRSPSEVLVSNLEDQTEVSEAGNWAI